MSGEAQAIDQVFAFALELDRLKAVLRKTRPAGLERYENSAEHSWQVCLLALAMQPYARERVDIARVIELLLVHDLGEIDAGDRIVYAGSDAARDAAERAGARRVFGLLPPEQRDRLQQRWEEVTARQTPEARYAYAMDRLMPVLQNLAHHGRSWRENAVTVERVLAVNGFIGEIAPEAWRLVEQRIRAVFAAGPGE